MAVPLVGEREAGLVIDPAETLERIIGVAQGGTDIAATVGGLGHRQVAVARGPPGPDPLRQPGTTADAREAGRVAELFVEPTSCAETDGAVGRLALVEQIPPFREQLEAGPGTLAACSDLGQHQDRLGLQRAAPGRGGEPPGCREQGIGGRDIGAECAPSGLADQGRCAPGDAVRPAVRLQRTEQAVGSFIVVAVPLDGADGQEGPRVARSCCQRGAPAAFLGVPSITVDGRLKAPDQANRFGRSCLEEE